MNQAKQVHLANQVALAVRVFPVLPDSPADHHQFARNQPSHRAGNAHLANQAIQVHQETTAILVHPANLAVPEMMDHPVHPDLRDHLVMLDNPDVMDHVVIQADQPVRHQHCPEIQDSPEMEDHLVCPESPANPDATDNPAMLARKDHPAILVHLAEMANLAIRDHEVRPVSPASVVSVRNTARLMVASSSKTAREESKREERDEKQQHQPMILNSNIRDRSSNPPMSYNCNCHNSLSYSSHQTNTCVVPPPIRSPMRDLPTAISHFHTNSAFLSVLFLLSLNSFFSHVKMIVLFV